MPTFIRVRFAAMRLTKRLRKSLVLESDRWEIGVDDDGRPTLTAGSLRVVIEPRAVRLLDALHLLCDDTEIWLPLWSRLRLRSMARLVLLESACEAADALAPTSDDQPTTTRRAKHKSSS